MEYRVLGPIEAAADGRTITIGAGKQRALLALLVMHANTAVSVDRIIEALWGAQPPASAVKVVQVLISQLRKVLSGGDGTSEIARVGGGYMLRVAAGRMDVDRFEQLLEAGRQRLAEGDPREAEQQLSDALALWRGGAYEDVAYEEFAREEIRRLEERRLAAMEERFEALLADGRHADAVADLEKMAAEHPLRERVLALWMLALYRCGRRAEALAAYDTARRRLADELGIEPGERLSRLHAAMLQTRTGDAPVDTLEPPTPRRRRAALLVGGTAPLDDSGSVAEVRTFLIADVRGYSGFTDREGNEAAARLAERFEAFVRETVTAGGGRVLDVRGDEVAADFASPSVALRTAMELQQRFAAVLREDSSLPLRVGVGVDVGEAVSVGEGYRGGALNRAARLCSLAKPGEVLLTESVLHLAGPIAGATYASRGRVRVKGIAEPLSVRQLVFDIEIPSVPSGSRRRRRWAWISAVALSLAVGATVIAVLLSSRAGGSAVVVAANSVAAIDPHTDRVVADIPVGATPTQIVAGSGYVWVLNANNRTISRIDPRTRQPAGSPFSVSATPTGLAAGAGALWVAAGDKNAVLRVNPTTELQDGAPIPVPGSINTYLHVVGVSFGAGQVYVISSGGTIGRWIRQ